MCPANPHRKAAPPVWAASQKREASPLVWTASPHRKATHDVSLISLHGPSHKRFLFPTACRNCDDPTCLLKCPVDAISRDRDGEVKIVDHCIGCSGCAVNCPYDTISLTPISAELGEAAREKAGRKKPVTQQAIKCNLCEDIPTGAQCVRSCPTAAILRFKPKQLVQHVLKGA